VCGRGDMAWHGMACVYGTVRYGTVRYGTVRYGTVHTYDGEIMFDREAWLVCWGREMAYDQAMKSGSRTLHLLDL